ncbi:hypothetical protein ACFYUV_11320 [Nonomuraea sp. NPDC003560]|uniref:hypothetical protein n=1 Tax=Nonomuraea sp. NPDC003560 TaxID=3364341 RepID=UPI0036C42585
MRAQAPASGICATTSRPVGPDTVTGCRPAVEVPGFRHVEQRPDGSWTAVHRASGEVIEASTFERLERIEAPIVRLAHGWRRGA